MSSVKINVIILDSQGLWENETPFQVYLAQNKMKMMATIFSCDCDKVTPHLLVRWSVFHGPRFKRCYLRRCGGSLESVFLILNQVVLSICSSYFHISFELGLTRDTLVFGESFGVEKQVWGGNISEWGLLTTNKWLRYFSPPREASRKKSGSQEGKLCNAFKILVYLNRVSIKKIIARGAHTVKKMWLIH